MQAEYAPDGGYIPRVMFADATGKLAPLIKNPNASPQCAPHCSAASAALCACFCGGPSRPCCHSTRVLQAQGSPLAACAGMATSTSPSRRCALRRAALSGSVMQAASKGFCQATEPLLAAPPADQEGHGGGSEGLYLCAVQPDGRGGQRRCCGGPDAGGRACAARGGGRRRLSRWQGGALRRRLARARLQTALGAGCSGLAAQSRASRPVLY